MWLVARAAGVESGDGWSRRLQALQAGTLAAGEAGWLVLAALFLLLFLQGCLFLALQGMRRPAQRPRVDPAVEAAQPEVVGGLSGWGAYLLAQLTGILVLSLLPRWHPLTTQYVYCCWMLLWLIPSGLRASVRPRKGWVRYALMGYAAALLGIAAFGVVFHPPPSANPAADWVRQAGGSELLGWLLLLCVFAPLQEECWYRGVLSAPTGVRPLLAAAVFASVHHDGGALVPLFWLALVLNRVRWRVGLAGSVLAHGLWNAGVALATLGA